MPLNVHIHPQLGDLKKLSFKTAKEKTESSSQTEDKNGIDGNEANKDEPKNNEVNEPVEENNETVNTLINLGITIAVVAVTIPIATWVFKKSAAMIREAKNLGAAITG